MYGVRVRLCNREACDVYGLSVTLRILMCLIWGTGVISGGYGGAHGGWGMELTDDQIWNNDTSETIVVQTFDDLNIHVGARFNLADIDISAGG